MTPEDITDWVASVRDDPATLRALADSASRFGSSVQRGAATAGDVGSAATQLAAKLQTVLTTLADAVGSLSLRASTSRAAYQAQERAVRAAIADCRG